MKNMFSGIFFKISKRAGWNTAVQAGIFQNFYKLSSTFIRQTKVVKEGKSSMIISFVALLRFLKMNL